MADFSGSITADVWAPTSAFDSGRGGHSVQYIVVHHEAAVGLTAASLSSMWSRMQSQSAHYSVDGDGVIAQHVYESDTAWACGNWTANQSSISIEHANNSTNPWTVSEATLESGAHLVAALLIKYGLGYPRWGGNVRPHSQIVATACPGELAGSQNAQYMSRVCYWYEVMTGTRTVEERGWHTNGKGSWWYQTGATSGDYATGWLKVGDGWYYFNESGWMLTGWVFASWSDSEKYWWYFGEDGALQFDKWLEYNNGWYMLLSDGRMATGWQERDGKRYYLDETGRMAAGWLKLDDAWYYLRSDGSCVVDGLYEVGAGNICAFDKDGRLLTGDITVTTNDDGYISGVKQHV